MAIDKIMSMSCGTKSLLATPAHAATSVFLSKRVTLSFYNRAVTFVITMTWMITAVVVEAGGPLSSEPGRSQGINDHLGGRSSTVYFNKEALEDSSGDSRDELPMFPVKDRAPPLRGISTEDSPSNVHGANAYIQPMNNDKVFPKRLSSSTRDTGSPSSESSSPLESDLGPLDTESSFWTQPARFWSRQNKDKKDPLSVMEPAILNRSGTPPLVFDHLPKPDLVQRHVASQVLTGTVSSTRFFAELKKDRAREILKKQKRSTGHSARNKKKGQKNDDAQFRRAHDPVGGRDIMVAETAENTSVTVIVDRMANILLPGVVHLPRREELVRKYGDIMRSDVNYSRKLHAAGRAYHTSSQVDSLSAPYANEDFWHVGLVASSRSSPDKRYTNSATSRSSRTSGRSHWSASPRLR